MLGPFDYSNVLIQDKSMRNLMDKITFSHGGPTYDEKYPEGIPTSVVVTLTGKNPTFNLLDNSTIDSGFVLYPKGHARNTCADLKDILRHKFKMMGALAMEEEETKRFLDLLEGFDTLDNKALRTVYTCTLKKPEVTVDGV